MGKYQQSERRHPESENRQESEKATADKQRTGNDTPRPGPRERQLETTEHKFSTVSVDAVFTLAGHSKPFGFMEKCAQGHSA